MTEYPLNGRKVTLTRRPRGPIARPLIRLYDAWIGIWLIFVLGMVVATPVRWQWNVCQALALHALIWGRARRGRAALVGMGGFDRSDAARIIRSLYGDRLFQHFNLVFGILREPRQQISLVGHEHLLQTLVLGRGAVLWMSDFVGAGDVVKIALHRHNLPISHLSRPEHGFGGSLFALKWLNPIRTRFENRFLAERLVFDRNRPQLVHARLDSILSKNGIVCITASQHEGVVLAETDFLKGHIRLAIGAPKIAYRAGCAIHPAFVLRDRSSPLTYSVVIGHPLHLPDSVDSDEAVRCAVADYVERLEQFVLDYPDMWVGWRRLGMLSQ